MKRTNLTALVLALMTSLALQATPSDIAYAQAAANKMTNQAVRAIKNTEKYEATEKQMPAGQCVWDTHDTKNIQTTKNQAPTEQDLYWDYDNELTETQDAFTYHAIPSKDGKEAWIYEISVRQSKDCTTLYIPEMLGDKKVTCIGYTSMKNPDDDGDSLYNILGYSVQPFHDVDGGYEMPRILSVALPDSLKVIKPAAFSGFDHMREIKFPAQVTSVEAHLFYGCDYLEKVRLPENLIQLESAAFENCPKLKKMTLSSSNQTYQIKGGCVITKKDKALVFSFSKKKTLNIPDGVKILKKHALSECVSATVKIPASVNKIESGVFHQTYGHQNKKVKNVTVSKKNKVYAKDGQCIYHRKDQTLAIAIPDKNGVLHISEKVRHLTDTYSLVNCDTYEKWLEKVVLPRQLKTIKQQGGNPLLTGTRNIYFTGKTPPKVKLRKNIGLFMSYTSIYVPKASYNKYKNWYKKYNDSGMKLHTF